MTTNDEFVAPRGQITWGDSDELLHAGTVEELDAVLTRIDQEARDGGRRMIAMVGLGGPRYFTIGLGRDETVVGTDDQSIWETWYSRGDLYDDEDDEDSWFWFGTEASYYPRWALIPMKTARDVAREIFVSGQRPDTIQWEEP